MTFTAKLKRTSTIWATWRESKRTSGEVCGVIFRLAPGLDYVTAPLSADEVEAMKHHNAIILEAVAQRVNGMHLAEPGTNPLGGSVAPDFAKAVEEVTEPVRQQVAQPTLASQPVRSTPKPSVPRHPRYQKHSHKGRR
jgi:hypothetical protein